MTQRSILCLRDLPSANRLSNLLARHRIPSRVLAKRLGAGSLFVLESASTHESEILDLAKQEGERFSLLGCPSCQSIRLDYPPVPDESATLRFIASFVSNIGNDNAATFYCRSCHYQWTIDLGALQRVS